MGVPILKTDWKIQMMTGPKRSKQEKWVVVQAGVGGGVIGKGPGEQQRETLNGVSG